VPQIRGPKTPERATFGHAWIKYKNGENLFTIDYFTWKGYLVEGFWVEI
jgi:hypothetical protein